MLVLAACLLAADPPREIYFEPQHIGLFGVAMTTGAVTSIPSLNRREPAWFTPGGFDRNARRRLKAKSEPGEVNEPAARATDALVFGVAPAVLIGSELAWGLTARVKGRGARARLILQDLAVVGEAFGLSLTTVNVIKISAGRRRPFAWAGAEVGIAVPYDDDKDQNASFPSGHSATAFSVAVAGATVASLRRYPHWRLAWLALAPAVAVPILRVAADKHFLSDVLVGSAIGAAFGVAIPLLVHNPRLRARRSQLSVSPFGRGVQLGIRW